MRKDEQSNISRVIAGATAAFFAPASCLMEPAGASDASERFDSDCADRTGTGEESDRSRRFDESPVKREPSAIAHHAISHHCLRTDSRKRSIQTICLLNLHKNRKLSQNRKRCFSHLNR